MREAIRTQPFYLRGLRNQQKLILKWVQEELNPNEPIDVERSTIEHVMPQTLTPDWRAALAADLDGESLDVVHERLVHSLGNLTLTGYNATLGNRPFPEKQAEYRRSSFTALNRLVLDAPVWGRTQILARSEWFADRITRQWTGPNVRARAIGGRRDWSVVHRAIAAIPAGRWTSYGDLAALIGTHPAAVGAHLAGTHIQGTHRVLQGSGTVAPGFRWPDPSDDRDPRAVLEAEGLAFSASGVARARDRLSTAALAARIGLIDGFVVGLVDG